MILAFDTYYFQDKARTVCLQFETWEDKQSYKIYTEIADKVEEYISGEFYKRELPCILSLIDKIEIYKIEAIIVDGFVILDDEKKPGLGAFLYTKLESKIPIIGVAKNNFLKIKKEKRKVYRGISKKPLYITSIGIDVDIAAEKIKSMDGEFRMPTLLKQLDRLTKENNHI